MKGGNYNMIYKKGKIIQIRITEQEKELIKKITDNVSQFIREAIEEKLSRIKLK